MMPYVYESKVWHRRMAPVRHDFMYRTLHLSLPLDQLEALNSEGGLLFGHNRAALLSLYDRDFLHAEEAGVQES